MKCHDGEECKLGCTEDRMQCALPVSIADELRDGFPIYPVRAGVIAGYVEKLEADLAAAQRELSAYRRALVELGMSELALSHNALYATDWIRNRVAELLAQEGVPAQPKYREPTIEDAREFERIYWGSGVNIRLSCLEILNQLGFVRKVHP